MNNFRRITIFLFLIGINSCNTYEGKTKEEKKTEVIFDTSYFNNLYNLYKDSSFTEFVINRQFSLIGEEGFLDSSYYDSYLIFTITENWKPLKVFVIKRRKNMTVISYKEILGNGLKRPVNKNEQLIIMHPNKITSKTQIVNDSFIFPFIRLVENMQIQKPNYYTRETIRELFYLNNSSYSYIDEDRLSNNDLVIFDSIIRNQREFKQLMNLDSIADDNIMK